MATLVYVKYEGPQYDNGGFTAPELELEDGSHVYAFWGDAPVPTDPKLFADGVTAPVTYPVYHAVTDEPAEALITHAEYLILAEAIDATLV